MNDQNTLQDMGIIKIIPGLIGALVSLRFVQGTWLEKGFMALGGAFLSYFATPAVATWMDIANTEGLVGFVLGLFGMAIVSKVYEMIQFIDAKFAVAEFIKWVARKWRA